jgi:hypothetical protein
MYATVAKVMNGKSMMMEQGNAPAAISWQGHKNSVSKITSCRTALI